MYAAAAVPLLGIAGGGFLGATAGILGSSLGATIAVGVAGAAIGAVAGVAVGAAAFFAANAVYDNKEYIIAGTALILYAPFALAGRGLKAAKEKLFGHGKKAGKTVDTATRHAAVQAEETDLTEKSAQPDFKKSAPKAVQPEKQPKAAPRKSKDRKRGL
ncbi:MAG: hypothetical protein D8M28_05305 [Proteobacteria bacterium]|nr:hypothetical protein [Pseudomonadota bacterium]